MKLLSPNKLINEITNGKAPNYDHKHLPFLLSCPLGFHHPTVTSISVTSTSNSHLSHVPCFINMNVLRILLNSKSSSETWESPCCLAWKSIHALALLLSTSLTPLPVTQGCCKFPQDSFGNKSRSDDSPAINTRKYPYRDLHKDFTKRAVALR